MKKKDLKIIIPILALALILLILSQVLPRENKQANAGALVTAAVAAENPSPSPAKEAGSPNPETSAQATPEPSPMPTLAPARAYLKVQIGSFVFEPLALTENRDLDLTQPDGKQNIVRVTPESIIMHSANCDNQDCVHQGMVSLENRGNRVLQNMIVCLPNQVVLQLLDPQEALVDWESAHGPLPEAETL